MNYSNTTGQAQSLAVEDVLATAEKLRALPKVVHDITVAPDVKRAMDRSPEMQALLTRDAAAPFGPMRVWVDETLPAGHWHKGVPLAEQIRQAAQRL